MNFLDTQPYRGDLSALVPIFGTSPDAPRQRLWGILVRGERWGLSWRARGNNGYSGDQAIAASAAAHLLRQAGVSAGLLEMVPARRLGRDQTYDSSVALRDWFRQNHIAVGSMNVVTEGTHARRTRLLFHEAVGKGVVIGKAYAPKCRRVSGLVAIGV